jgi:phosphatidylinositol phosphate synthase
MTLSNQVEGVQDGGVPRSRGQKMEEGLRWFSDFFFRPVTWLFGNLGLSPNLITMFGLAVAIASGYFLAVGSVPLAAGLFTFAGVLDIVDGYIAKKLDRITVFGSFLDSFSDRLSDAAIFLGLMVYYLELGEGVYVGLALVVLVTSFLISYVRARAESLDVHCKAGLMARAPRTILLLIGLFFNGLSPWVLRVVLWILAVLLVETLVERLIEVWKALKE